ncbi:PREDICTED: phosphatidylinositol N-acetylglucosaminyltransferase subunit C [Nicrophorus vespilloides]|uniref:Phosphatidylinositol N-acetylglucosaminyltransferase subunit C n=1 Tax=Nicrophorus vespilloides TaxID=110193 RepID=A0ABM1NHG8_NICVS|nr:PREDICTED: phosphatidylinositol N-acetylglucosaminyltransferase subunit C [Nicrophorus vespilloides]
MSKKKKPWKKILYEDQGYPDYYTDQTFLWELKRNTKLKAISLHEAILEVSVVVQELCAVIIFALIYVLLHEQRIDPAVTFYTISALSLVCFLVYRKFLSSDMTNALGNDIRTLLIFLVFGQLFSPVLHTLTDTISTNTIYMMTFFMMLVHLIFFDYGVPAAIVSNSLSLSAAVFASICLASRLASAYHAFVLITIAIEIFVLFPLLRKKFGRSIVMCSILILVTIGLLQVISPLMNVCFVMSVIFINFICPFLFVKNQSFKDNIYGPWDEAVVHDVDSVYDLIYS